MRQNGAISITTPLGDALLIRRMSGTEHLGRLYQYDLELLSKKNDINMDDLLGQPMTVTVQLLDGGERHFHGLVNQYSQVGTEGNYVAYHATLVPWFWFLTRTMDSRIFQEMKVPDIIKQVFRDLGYSDFEDTLSGHYREWNYCVQYRETDFNFVSRLMEQEGIYYYFKHENSKHTLVLSDSVSSHQTVSGYEEIPYFPPDGTMPRRERDHISSWALTKSVQPGAYVLNEYDFEKPKASLLTNSTVSRAHTAADFEMYDYPGEFVEYGDGENYVQVRIQELQAQHELAAGSGNVRGVTTGALFGLTGFTRDDQNREYLVVSTNYELIADAYESTGGLEPQDSFTCGFTAMNSQEPYRSPRSTRKPIVQGPQTAVVVGKSGEEIWTDQYGRIKVHFHWDRYDKSDENSSCWVRVSQVWAGKNWGAMHIPRIGQEVIVDFLEGDPDRPIITGRVYNADNMPPYELPANKTQSGVKSRSSKGGNGANFNEIRFEDLKGKEQLYIHAEKNQDNVVENDETTQVGHDRTESVGNNESISIGKNRSEDVGDNEKVKIGINRNHNIGKNDTLDVGKNLVVTAGDMIKLETGAASIVMKKNGDITIKGKNITVKASSKINAKASSTVTIKGSKVLTN